MAHRAVRVEMRAVPAGDAGGFLAAMLERVEPERDQRSGALHLGHAEDAALLAELVPIIGEMSIGVSGQHLGPPGVGSGGHIGGPRRFVAPDPGVGARASG